MAFVDALQDTASISTVTTVTGATGAQEKVITPLYTNIPCRLHIQSGVFGKDVNAGEIDPTRDFWTMLVQVAYDGANEKDRVTVRGDDYIITKKQYALGSNATANHMIYYLKEQV